MPKMFKNLKLILKWNILTYDSRICMAFKLCFHRSDGFKLNNLPTVAWTAPYVAGCLMRPPAAVHWPWQHPALSYCTPALHRTLPCSHHAQDKWHSTNWKATALISAVIFYSQLLNKTTNILEWFLYSSDMKHSAGTFLNVTTF